MRKGFTLIELIFAIVIIGVLAAVAVPQFAGLKQSAEVNNLVKMVKDAESAVPPAALNKADLENITAFELRDILKLDGQDISYDGNDVNGSYTIAYGGTDVAKIVLDIQSRNLTTGISCNDINSTDTDSGTKCVQALGNSDDYNGTTNEYNATISW